jgi:TPR repeat protein
MCALWWEADYTFRSGTYLNAQFMHGFFHERGKGNLNDYLIIAAERSAYWLARSCCSGHWPAEWWFQTGTTQKTTTPYFSLPKSFTGA